MRVLIVKIAFVGDVVMALPMIPALREREPSAQITWICGKSVSPLLVEVPGIEIVPVNEAKLLMGSFPDRLREILSVWRRLFARRFDLVATGYSDRRYRLLTLPVWATCRRRFNRGRGRWWPFPGRYHGDEYVRLVTGEDGSHCPRAVFPKIKPRLNEELERLAGSAVNLVALAPGGAKNLLEDVLLRRWSIGSYVELAKELLNRGFSVAITGSASDEWVRAHFRGLQILDAIGKTSTAELVAFYQRCTAVITHDSGSLHLAVLAGAPTVALFGPTRPNEKVVPGERLRVIWGGENLTCRPCYDGKLYSPCKDNQCMKQISVTQVLASLEDLVARTRGSESS